MIDKVVSMVKSDKEGNLVCGVGVNDSDYVTEVKKRVGGKRVVLWVCPFYRKWKNMLKRCYNTSYLKTRPTYQGCSVCEEWHTFSNFKKWMEQQDWEGKHLDKDLLFEGNKIYSPNTCIFVHSIVNSFVLKPKRTEKCLPSGVTARGNGFLAQCNDPFKRRKKRIGVFNTPEEAHIAWAIRKYEYAVELSESDYVSDDRVREVLLSKFYIGEEE